MEISNLLSMLCCSHQGKALFCTDASRKTLVLCAMVVLVDGSWGRLCRSSYNPDMTGYVERAVVHL